MAKGSARRVSVVTNEAGEILAIGPAEGRLPPGKDEDGPTHGRFEPLKGQKVLQVDAIDELSDPEKIEELHKTHRIEVKGGIGHFVRHAGGEKKP